MGGDGNVLKVMRLIETVIRFDGKKKPPACGWRFYIRVHLHVFVSTGFEALSGWFGKI
jgi:hypothetical protein